MAGFKNTTRTGTIRSLIFKEGDTYFGAALELNIVEQGDTPQEAMLLLDDAVKGYLETARKDKLSVRVLNQEVEPEHESLWNAAWRGGTQGKRTVYRVSSQPIAALTA